MLGVPSLNTWEKPVLFLPRFSLFSFTERNVKTAAEYLRYIYPVKEG